MIGRGWESIQHGVGMDIRVGVKDRYHSRET
jgi:hypothetical protein